MLMKIGDTPFYALMQPVDKEKAVFQEEGYLVWCGSAVRGPEGNYYLYYSRWPAELGHNAWVTHSEVAYAVSESPYGGFVPQGLVLRGSGGDGWDADVVHNPTVLEADGKYYLYYVGNYGNGEYWNHRNHQRVGVAMADHPKGPWRRFEKPVVDVTKGSFDHLLTSNPTVTRGEDGRYYMVYKAVADGPLPKGGAVVCGVAVAEHPTGPFVKHPVPIMTNPENPWSVEDPYIWFQDHQFYSLVKDFQGYFTNHGRCTVALFTSENGVDWYPAKQPFAFDRKITWTDGTTTALEALERPQLLLENGKPKVLYCAASATEDRLDSFNVAIPLKQN